MPDPELPADMQFFKTGCTIGTTNSWGFSFCAGIEYGAAAPPPLPVIKSVQVVSIWTFMPELFELSIVQSSATA